MFREEVSYLIVVICTGFLVLGSLNTITKETAVVSVILGWPSPDPGLGAPVELRGGHPGGLLDLLGIGKTLPSKRIAAKEAPPSLLQIEPACPRGNEDVMDAWMPFQPGARLEAGVTTESVGDDEQVAPGVVGFDVGQQGNVAFGIARSRTARHLFAAAHAASAPETHVFSGPRPSSISALMRWPSGDQPGAGGTCAAQRG